MAEQPAPIGETAYVSLWTLIPLRVRWSLLPLFTSAFLVGAGEELASTVEYFFQGQGREGGSSDAAAADVEAFLLLLNVFLSLWVFNRILSLEIDDPSLKIDFAARFLNFAAIFVSLANLVKLAARPDQQAYVALYGLVAVLYLVVVPFFVVGACERPTEPPRARADALLLSCFLRMTARTTLYGVAVCMTVLIFVGIPYASLNDGLPIPGYTLRPIEQWFGQRNRNDFWLVNPMLLGVATLQVCTLRFGKVWIGEADVARLMIPPRRMRLMVIVSGLLIVALAVAMLSDKELLQQDSAPAALFANDGIMSVAEGVIGGLYGALFFSAFFLAERFNNFNSFEATRKTEIFVLGLTIFLSAGVIAGGLICFTLAAVSADPLGAENAFLVGLHAGAFGFAYLGLVFGGHVVAKRVRGTAPLLFVAPKWVR